MTEKKENSLTKVETGTPKPRFTVEEARPLRSGENLPDGCKAYIAYLLGFQIEKEDIIVQVAKRWGIKIAGESLIFYKIVVGKVPVEIRRIFRMAKRKWAEEIEGEILGTARERIRKLNEIVGLALSPVAVRSLDMGQGKRMIVEEVEGGTAIKAVEAIRREDEGPGAARSDRHVHFHEEGGESPAVKGLKDQMKDMTDKEREIVKDKLERDIEKGGDG